MKAILIASTSLDHSALVELGYAPHWLAQEADELAEFAGRNCYRSFNRPNPKTATSVDYLANIIDQNHESVFEHGSATFYIDASRSVLAELTRHRFLSFSVVSQRYVNATDLGYHIPPAIRDLPPGKLRQQTMGILEDAQQRLIEAYERIAQNLLEANDAEGDRTPTRKQAREAARAVLPNMTASPMVVSGNHRAWKDVLRKRWHLGADAEIRELAGMILAELRQIAPHTYQDVPEEPYQ